MLDRNKKFIEQLQKLEQESQAQDIELWGTVQGSFAGSTSLANSPKFREIISILTANPILVMPALKWLQIKCAQMSRAQLNVLYTPEELEAMTKELQNS